MLKAAKTVAARRAPNEVPADQSIFLPSDPPPSQHLVGLSQEERGMVLAALEAYAIRFAETPEQRRSYQGLSDKLAKAPPQEHLDLPIVKTVCQHCERVTVVPAETIRVAIQPSPPQMTGLERMTDIAEARLMAIHKALDPEAFGITGIESPEDHVEFMTGVLRAALTTEGQP